MNQKNQECGHKNCKTLGQQVITKWKCNDCSEIYFEYRGDNMLNDVFFEELSEKEKKCTCQYDEAKKYISESGLVHNKNCPKSFKWRKDKIIMESQEKKAKEWL